MASQDEIQKLRELLDEIDETGFWSADALRKLIDESVDLDEAAAKGWTTKAAQFAGLVDVQEGNSKRSLGDLYEQAVAMSKVFLERSSVSAEEPTAVRRSRTRKVERQ